MPFGLQRFDAGAVTRRLELPEISVDPAKPLTLIVRHAGMTNPRWDSWALRRPASKPSTLTADSPEARIADRLADRAETNAMLSEAVIEGWENVVENGEAAPFGVEAARRFLDEIAVHCPDVWQRILRFAYAISNFRAAGADPIDLGKG